MSVVCCFCFQCLFFCPRRNHSFPINRQRWQRADRRQPHSADREPGTGDIGPTGIFIDTAQNLIHIDVHWGSGNGFTDLTMPVMMLHLHGPTPSAAPDSFSENADLLINIGNSLNFDGSPTDGELVDDFFVSNAEIDFIRQGRSYINVHFSMNDTGMIRGYLVMVPEPTGAFLGLCAVCSLASLRRRRHA